MRRLLWCLVALGVVLGAACSSSDGGSSSGVTPDASVGPDGRAAVDGAAPGEDAGAEDASAQDSASDAALDADADAPGTFTLTSTAFAPNGFIPAVHTLGAQPACNAASESPPLTWTNAPAAAQSFAIVMRDVTLVGDNYHWVIYDIPAATTSLPQNVQQVASPPVPAGAKQTYWSFSPSQYSYRGPCPPSLHEYQFTVYAIGVASLPAAGETNPATVDALIQANKIEGASLTGKYQP